MSDREILKRSAASAKLTQKDGRKAFDSMMTLLMGEMDEGGRVMVPGFGVFKTVARQARTGTDPRTRQKIRIPASVSVGFKPSEDFKKDLNAPLASRQEREKKEWEEKKERARYVAFDAASVPVRKAEPTVIAEPVPAAPVLPPMPETAPQPVPASPVREIRVEPAPVIPSAPSAEMGSLAQTIASFQNRILILVLAVIPAVLLAGILAGLLLFRTPAFDRMLKEKVAAQSRESQISLAESEKRITERLQEMQLDVSQTRDMFKRELSAMQDETQRKTEEKLTAAIRKELAARNGRSQVKTKAAIKIIRYRVRRGDNLWRISETRSGNPYNWVGIYLTNGKRIRNPDRIYPGQEILIPVIIER
jgi:DNA-binding protein HU-beta